MKTLVLVRHAKSDKDIPGLTDFERPLNTRGELDAKKMTSRFVNKNIKPDIIISSPAVRAYATMKCFAEALDFDIAKVTTQESVYFGNTLQLIRTIQKLDDKNNCAMIFGHNPDITELADRLTGTYFENISTCGVVCIDFDVSNWSDVDDGIGMLRFYDYPKKVE